MSIITFANLQSIIGNDDTDGDDEQYRQSLTIATYIVSHLKEIRDLWPLTKEQQTFLMNVSIDGSSHSCVLHRVSVGLLAAAYELIPPNRIMSLLLLPSKLLRSKDIELLLFRCCKRLIAIGDNKTSLVFDIDDMPSVEETTFAKTLYADDEDVDFRICYEKKFRY